MDAVDWKTFKAIRKSYEAQDLQRKAAYLSSRLPVPLEHIEGVSYDPADFRGNIENPIGVAQVPLGLVGPLLVQGRAARGEFWIPMATTEGALVLSYDMGARLATMSGGVKTEVLSNTIHITPMFPISGSEDTALDAFLDSEYAAVKRIAEGESSHTHLLGIDRRRVGSNYLLRFRYNTEDAHGLNMINLATFRACKYIQSCLGVRFYHRSHYSGVKHHSPLNEQEGFGRSVRASAVISSRALSLLQVDALRMKDFFDRCIEVASSTGVTSVNVHAANAIAAISIACGQDPADLSSSHVCSTSVELRGDGDLYIECLLKNLLVATVGGGTGLGTQRECLRLMECEGSGMSDKLAELIAATVLVGEFPTAAAVLNESYVDSHEKYGRNRPVLHTNDA